MSIQLEATAPVAGWYEDPLSPSAARWWNGFGWTEHTQAPSAAAHVGLASEPSAWVGRPAMAVGTAAPAVPKVDSPRPRSGRSAAAAGGRRAPVMPAWLRPTRWNTPGVWAMSLTPWTSVVIAFTIGALVTLGAPSLVVLAAVLLPVLLWITFAVRDRRRLAVLGYQKRASWAWVLLSPVAYEIARGIRVHRASGHGWAPLVLLLANTVIVAGAAVGVAFVVEAPSAPQPVNSVESSITHNLVRYLPVNVLQLKDAP